MSTVRRIAVRSVPILVCAVVVTALDLSPAGTLSAQSNDDFTPDITIAELMDAVVMREADVVWGAVQFASTEDGYVEIGPETEEGWTELRYAALALAEASNSLVVPGRHANVPDALAGEGELAPGQIDALIAERRGAWVAFAHALHSASMDAVAAIDTRNLEEILDVGGAIDEACEACHVVFWYPDQ